MAYRTTLEQYYASVDAGDIDHAMSLVAPDVRFAILLPGKAVRGADRQGLVDYLSGRGEVVRRHVVSRSSRDGDLEFVYGKVVEDARTTTGHFLAAVHRDEAGLISSYQVSFDPELGLLPPTGATEGAAAMNNVPVSRTWFETMDSDTPERVLDMITDDFEMSVLFATSDGAAEFHGDREGLVGYLEQREKSVLTHHILRGQRMSDTELVLGETRRGNTFEASFNSTAQLSADGRLVRRLLICRTPRVGFAT
jgi:ketosteroid isomerase-like protein